MWLHSWPVWSISYTDSPVRRVGAPSCPEKASRVAIDVIGWVMFTVLVGAIVAAAAWLVYSWCKGRLRNEELYADENRAVNPRSSNVSGGGTMY